MRFLRRRRLVEPETISGDAPKHVKSETYELHDKKMAIHLITVDYGEGVRRYHVSINQHQRKNVDHRFKVKDEAVKKFWQLVTFNRGKVK